MIVEKINKLIEKERKNIVFFFDEDGSTYEELNSITDAGIKVIEVDQKYFHLKYQLEFELKDQKIFLYHSFKRPDSKELKKYPLLDLLIANSELRLDDASEFLSTYHLPMSQLSLVKRYLKQLKTKTNQKKLSRILEPKHFNEENLKLGLISIVLEFNTVVDKNTCLAKLFTLSLDKFNYQKLKKSLVDLDLEDEIISWLNGLVKTQHLDLNYEFIKETVSSIKYNVLTSLLESTSKHDTYTQLKLERTSDINRVVSFYQDWSNHPSLKKQIEPVFNEIGSAIQTSKILEWYGMEQEFGYYSAEMLQSIINNLYHFVSENPVKAKDHCIKWLRSPALTDEMKGQVRFIYYTAGMYITMDSYRSFRFNKPDDYIKEYTQDLYKIDLNYRKAVLAFDKIKDKLYEHEDVAVEIFDGLNKKYDRYLIELNVEWQKAMNEIQFNYKALEVDKQYDFYKKNLKGFEYKMVVIISDAFRYELGYELFNDLLSDSKNNLTIEPALASIPSYTNLGMTNLLPHSTIELEKGDADLVFKINGKSTASTNREAILKSIEHENKNIDYKSFRKMDKIAKRAFLKDSNITYLYHDWIDAIGDKQLTEDESFEASTKAINDIKWTINNITGELGISYVLVTSDHGFLYNYNKLSEASRENLPKSTGYVRDHLRFVVADDFEGKVDGYQFDLSNTTNIKTDLKVAVPRAINRYRKQGNVGVQFVHGGASLQELIIPVVKFYKQKKETSETVSFKRFDQTEKITSGNLKVLLLQDQPVSNEYKSVEVILGLYSDSGELLSNEVVIQFNSTSNNPKERVSDALLTLNSKGSQASFCYLKAFDKNDKSRLNPLGITDLIKISTLMEKDEFEL